MSSGKWWPILVALGCAGTPLPRGSVEEAPAPGGASLCEPPSAPVLIARAPSSRLDSERIGAAFGAFGYSPPEGTHLLVGREIDGEPGVFEWFSLGDSGLAPSQGRYWPASTVKVMTAVAALESLGKHGLNGSTRVSFVDEDGAYDGTVMSILEAAVRVSDNVAYNRTVELAGFDELNDRILPRWGLRHTTLQRRYTRPTEVTTLRRSPQMTWSLGGRHGVIPERVGVGRHPECPADGNCTTLYELLSVLRRLVLHRELPAAERFAIADEDADALLEAMRQSRTRLARGAEAALGPVLVYNKTGTVPRDDRLDHGMVVQLSTGRRFLVALSIRWEGTRNTDAEELTRMALLAVADD